MFRQHGLEDRTYPFWRNYRCATVPEFPLGVYQDKNPERAEGSPDFTLRYYVIDIISFLEEGQ